MEKSPENFSRGEVEKFPPPNFESEGREKTKYFMMIMPDGTIMRTPNKTELIRNIEEYKEGK